MRAKENLQGLQTATTRDVCRAIQITGHIQPELAMANATTRDGMPMPVLLTTIILSWNEFMKRTEKLPIRIYNMKLLEMQT